MLVPFDLAAECGSLMGKGIVAEEGDDCGIVTQARLVSLVFPIAEAVFRYLELLILPRVKILNRSIWRKRYIIEVWIGKDGRGKTFGKF